MALSALVEQYGPPPTLQQVRDALVRRAQREADAGRATELEALKARCSTIVGFTEYRMPRYRCSEVHRFVASKLEDVAHGRCKRLMIREPPRHGKQLADSVDVLTPTGWRKHGDLKPGDSVFGPDGRPTRVVAVSAPSDEKVRVTFSNGESIVCHPNHEWTVWDRAKGVWRTLEARQIARRVLHCGPVGKRGGRYLLGLPDVAAVWFSAKELPLDPYVLGAWLGDGTTGAPLIAHAPSDIEVIERVVACGFAATRRYVQSTGVAYTRFGSGRPNVRSPLTAALYEAGVLFDKHIPEPYLRSSVEQRLQLLAGLIDTDGHVEQRTGRVRFVTTSERLRDGVIDLATTLGFRPYVVEAPPVTSSSGIVGRKTVWQVGFQPTLSLPTRIPRKQCAVRCMRRRIAVVSVEPCAPESGRCIQVDREDGLYLAGRSLLPTHNSELASKSFPSFTLGHQPWQQFIAASANAELAKDFGREVRNIIASEPYRAVFDTRLAEDSRAAGKWNTSAGGCWYSVGVGGDIMGRGAHHLLIDDPYGSMQDARSEVIRKGVASWYSGTVYNRLEPEGSIVIIGHRMHEDDLQGMLEEKMRSGDSDADQWEIVELPAIAQRDDPMGRVPGAALWPEHFNIEVLHRIEANMLARDWSALYMQQPVPEEGELFAPDMLQVLRSTEDVREWVRGWDTAGTVDGDWTVGALVGRKKDGRFMVGDIVRFRGRPHQVRDKIVETARRDGKKVRISIPQDPGVGGLAWANDLVLALAGFPVEASAEAGPMGNSKADRARPLAAQVNNGHVDMLEGDWNHVFREELRAFPYGKYDDQVDATSRAFNVVSALPRPMQISDEAVRRLGGLRR